MSSGSEHYREARQTAFLVLKFIRAYTETHGYSPSIKEIADAIGRNMATTSYHLTAMRKSGLVTREPGGPRTIRLTDKGRARLAG
jgi:repressor LexA